MSRQSQRALVASLMMVLASLAGCIGTDDLEEETSSLGTVMVSTYHISELVSAVGGDLVEVEMISTTNMPVHDFEPSAQDIIRLQSADVFLYHGLGLEPWVDGALDSLGSDAPPASATHAMPEGIEILDFESLMVDELCRYLAEPSTTDVHLLAEHAEDADELHGDAGAYSLVMPEHEEEHHEEEGEHDHEEDEHDHENDRHFEPLEMISTDGSDCPAETTVSVYHLEEGEYVLEFEAPNTETFTIAMAAMAGAHDHAHDHDEHDEGEHDDDRDDHDEGEHDDDRDDHDDDMTPEEAMLEFDANNDSNLSWDEFWVAWNMEDDDDDGHDHGDDEHHSENETSGDDGHDHEDEHSPLEEAMEEYMMDLLMPMFNESDTDNSGSLSLEELEHFIEDIEAMEDDDADTPRGEFIVGIFDEDGDSMLSFEEFSEMMGMEHDGHAHNETGEGNETHDENESAEEEFMEAMMQMMFDMYDTNSDGSLNASEVDMMFEMMGEEDDHHEEGVGFIHLHVEREGDYGIALPAGVELHVLGEGGHDGHDHDERHDEEDHDDHGDEEDERHDEEDHDDHGDEEALEFDPHSWLNPMAFAAQIDVVSGVLSTAFPDGADTFQVNAEAYKAGLNQLDADYEAAFGATGTCSETTVAANHNAYAYMANAYDLEFVTVHGLDPEGEPTAEDIVEVVERVSEDEITVLFVEEFTDASAVESLVQQTVSETMPDGILVLTLYTMEMAPLDSNDDYMSLMTKNLENLKTGLGC